jgi:hypothetical protein
LSLFDPFGLARAAFKARRTSDWSMNNAISWLREFTFNLA